MTVRESAAVTDVELKDGRANLGEIDLHYVESGEGELYLMLHGFPQFWRLWRAQLEDLGRDVHAVAPDMRGYNLSSKPQDAASYRMRELLGDIRGLADHFGAEQFTLVGHDWGGIVSWAFASKYPELLERLVICDAPPPFTWGRELERSERQRQAVRYMVELAAPPPHGETLLSDNDFAVLDALVMEPGLAGGYLTEADRGRYHEAWSQPGALTGALNYYRAAGMGDQVLHGQSPRVRAAIGELRIEVPTLVIWGERDDKLLPGLTDGLEEWIPDVRVEVLEGAGHWTPQQQPGEVTRLIREFCGIGGTGH